MRRTEKFIEVNAPVEVVFDLYSDFENFPRWMKSVREVRRTGRRYTRWAADAPFGMSVEWEAETTRFEPNRKIAWRTVRGDVEMEGEVTFQETRRGTTLMRVRVGYDPPAGRLGSLFARLFGNNPDEQMEEELHNFARMAESLAKSRDAQQRDTYADARRRPSPPARRVESRRRSRREEIIRMDERAFRDEMWRRSDRREDHEPFAYHEEQPHWERMARESFEEALRHARRSQIEGMRRYNEERDRAERRRWRDDYYSDDGRGARSPDNRSQRRDFRHEQDERETGDLERRRRSARIR